MKGQISAELIIVLAALIAMALFLATQLKGLSVEGAEKVQNLSDRTFTAIDNITNMSAKAEWKQETFVLA